MDFLYIFERLAELFIIMFIGYGIVAGKLIPQVAMKYFSNFIFYVTLPAMIIYSLSGGTNVPAEEVFEILIISTLIHGFLIIVSLTVPKLIRVPKDRIGLYSFMLLFGNVAFLGFPVVKAVIGEEALFHTALFNLPFNLLVFTIGVYYITKDTKMKGAMSLKKFINPGIVATLLGLIFFALKIELPSMVTSLSKGLGDITTPLSLFVVGGNLYGVNVKMILKRHLIFIVSFLKLLVIPIIVAVALWAFGVDGLPATVSVIIAAMPIAANTVILSQEYDGHVLESSEAVFISTLLMAVTLPIIVLVNQFFFG